MTVTQSQQVLEHQVIPVFQNSVQQACAAAPFKYQPANEKEYNAGQLIEQVFFYVLEDRPVLKERVSRYVERQVFEREYVRELKPISEKPLPKSTEVLERQLLKTVNGGQVMEDDSDQLAAAVSNVKEAHQRQKSDNAEADNLKHPTRILMGKAGAAPMHSPEEDSDAVPPANPFKGFVQQEAAEAAPQMRTDTSETPSQPTQAVVPALERGSVRGKLHAAKQRMLHPFKWRFSAPFKSKAELSNDPNSQIPPATQEPKIVEHLPLGPQSQPQQETKALPSDSAVAPAHGEQLPQSRDGSFTFIKPAVTASAAAVPHQAEQKVDSTLAECGGNQRTLSRIEASADEGRQQTYFTQIEEERIVKEKIERFIEHQYFQLEFVIQVRYLGERRGHSSTEVLSRQRVLRNS